MSWRAGSDLFIEFWPSIQKRIPDQEHRLEFTAGLLKVLVRGDMDTYDVEDIHPEVREAMRMAGLRIAEPERYPEDATMTFERRPWWRFWH